MSAPTPPLPAGRGPGGWAIGLSVVALCVSLAVAALVALQLLFGFPQPAFGWFAYGSPPGDVGMGMSDGMGNEGVVSVDASGGVSGEAVAAALSLALHPSSGRLRCGDVSTVTADATSVCIQANAPEERLVVLFLDTSGRFVWSPVFVDPGLVPPGE